MQVAQDELATRQAARQATTDPGAAAGLAAAPAAGRADGPAGRQQQANCLSQSLQLNLDEQRLGLERENEVADLTIAYATENVAAADQ